MKVKPVPDPPGSLDAARDVCAALPLVPQAESDCCGRLVDRAGVESRDAARDWLPFLAALGLATESDRGYARPPEEPDRESVAESFREDVYLARETLGALGEDPRSVADVFERTEDRVPRWERNRNPDWETAWRDRTRRLLEWAVLLGLAERVNERYVEG